MYRSKPNERSPACRELEKFKSIVVYLRLPISLENQFLSETANLSIYWDRLNKGKYKFSSIP